MSLILNGVAVPTSRGFLTVLLSGLLSLALFCPAESKAQEMKQIKLTDKHIQGFIAASEGITKLSNPANPNEPDQKMQKQVEAVVKKNGFASFSQFNDVSANISMIMSGIDEQTKAFIEPPDQIKNEIAALRADKSLPDAQKKEDLAQLDAALKEANPIQFKENIALVLKYYDKLVELMQEQGPAD